MLSNATASLTMTGIPAVHFDDVDRPKSYRLVALWLVLFMLMCSIVIAIDGTEPVYLRQAERTFSVTVGGADAMMEANYSAVSRPVPAGQGSPRAWRGQRCVGRGIASATPC